MCWIMVRAKLCRSNPTSTFKCSYLSWDRKGLLVWTGVGGPEISEGVEHGACGSRCVRRREPWVM